MRWSRSLIHTAALALPLLAFAPGAFASNPFDGLWCGQGLLSDFSLKLKALGGQQMEGSLMRRDQLEHAIAPRRGRTTWRRGSRCLVGGCGRRP